MALPTTNITTTIVRNELGVATNNVGALCVHSNVNMWSKRKPVRDSRLSIPVNEVGVGNSQNSAENYGLIVPAYQGDDNLTTTYVKPTGGSSSPYRLGDFRGYDHNAGVPVIIQPPPAELAKTVQSIVSIVAMPGGGNVTIGDILGFIGNLRIGVMVYASGAGIINTASSEHPGGGSVNIDLTGLPYSKLDIKFCLTDYYKPWSSPGGMTALYEIPRAYRGQNRNWTGIPLVTYVPPTAIPVFYVQHSPEKGGRLDVGIETLTYSGPIYIQIVRASDGSPAGSISGESVPSSGSLHTFFKVGMTSIVPGTAYKARVWLHSTAVGAFDKEVTFTALMPVD